MLILVNPLIDKGYFRLCFNGGSLLLVLSVLVTSWCTKWWHLLLVQGIITGAAMGLIFGTGVVVLMSYFSKRMGLATGIASSGGAVGMTISPSRIAGAWSTEFTGGMIYPAVAKQLVFKIGFPWTLRGIFKITIVKSLQVLTFPKQLHSSPSSRSFHPTCLFASVRHGRGRAHRKWIGQCSEIFHTS